MSAKPSYRLRDCDNIGYSAELEPEPPKSYALRAVDQHGYALDIEPEKPRTYQLRAIDVPARAKVDAQGVGTCGCGHARDLHFRDVVEGLPDRFFACLCCLCGCKSFARAE